MISCCFKAKARFPIFSVHDLDIMRAGIRNCQRDNVTGFLLREDNSYLGVVEGSDPAIDRLISHISLDDRVFGIHVLSRDDTASRDYPSWSMGYIDAQNLCCSSKAIREFLRRETSSHQHDQLPAILKHMCYLRQRQDLKDQRLRESPPPARMDAMAVG